MSWTESLLERIGLGNEMDPVDQLIAALQANPSDPAQLATLATQIEEESDEARTALHALRQHPARVTVFVPYYAMSGGTLIALAADEIVLSRHAVLGPMDPQINQLPAASVLRVLEQKQPGDIDDETAAAIMLKGGTVEYLVRRTFPVKAGDRALVHAAAGGMGLILCQWAKHLGATIVGTVSSEAKAALAREAGADHIVIHGKGDFVDTVREATSGEGCAVVYESIGKDTFRRSLDCLRPMGMMACYGHASGPPDPMDVIELGARGSLFLTRPAIMHYMAKRDDLVRGAEELFEVLGSGAVKSAVNHVYPLSDVGEAHRAIEARETTGSTVLLPWA
mgnify:CR=1 FL=1